MEPATSIDLSWTIVFRVTVLLSAFRLALQLKWGTGSGITVFRYELLFSSLLKFQLVLSGELQDSFVSDSRILGISFSIF